MQDKFNFTAMPQQKLYELSMAILKNNPKTLTEELIAFKAYLRALSDKELKSEDENILTAEEKAILSLQTTVYMAHIEETEAEAVEDAIIKGMLVAEDLLSRLNAKTPLATIMSEKPDTSMAPKGMSCLALKIDGVLNWEWVWGSGNILGSMFVLHESADGSVEKYYQNLREKHNSNFDCNCSCHDPKYDVMHCAPCCSITYAKMFTRLMPPINFE